MNSFQKALQNQNPESSISEINYQGELFTVLDLSKEKNVRVLSLDLSEYKMQVPEKILGFEYAVLYFCVPTYWDLSNSSDENVNWMFEWLLKIKNHTHQNNTWLGDGHTYDCSKNAIQLSETMKQNHFFISRPLYLEEELKPLIIDEKTVHFWALIPIFGDEMDYKQSKGTEKFRKKLISKGVSEKLDEYRQSSLRNRWLFF
jgi:hypothetical protein